MPVCEHFSLRAVGTPLDPGDPIQWTSDHETKPKMPKCMFTISNSIGIGFLAQSWHITSRGMFAGSCIGVILMVMLLEFLRRTAKEYDRLLLRQHQRAIFAETSSSGSSTPQRAPAPPAAAQTNCCDGADSIESENNDPKSAPAVMTAARSAAFPARRTTRFRPNVMQQTIRALLHMLQFALAYFVMLLAMYYNGYLIICIFIGAFLGAFIFSWESVEVAVGGSGM